MVEEAEEPVFVSDRSTVQILDEEELKAGSEGEMSALFALLRTQVWEEASPLDAQ